MASQSTDRRTLLKGITSAGLIGVAGCSGDGGGTSNNGNESTDSTGASGEGVSLQFAGWGESGLERETVEQGITEFADQSDAVASANYTHIPYDDYHSRLQTQFGSNEEPNVFYVDMNWVATFAQSDVLVNYDEQYDDSFFDDFYSNVLDRYRVDGSLHMMPYAYASVGVTYNEELLSQAGYDEFPETWSEFKSALEGIKSETDVNYPLVEEGSGTTAAWIWYPWLAANGGSVMNEDNTECVVASDEAVESLEYFQELRDADLIGTINEVGAETKWSILDEGQSAMVTGGGWVPGTVKSEFPDLYEHTGVAKPPHPEGGQYGNLVFGAGYSVSSQQDNAHRNASLDLVQYMLEDGIVPYLEEGIAQPIRQSHADQLDLYDEDEKFQVFLDITDDRLIDWQWGQQTQGVFNELYPQIEGVIQGEVEPRDALETAQQRINSQVLTE